MDSKKQSEKLAQDSMNQMMLGLNGILKLTEQNTKAVFEGMGKAEAKKFAKTMEDMKFHDSINTLKSEVEKLKKQFKQV